jgi:cyanophycinase
MKNILLFLIALVLGLPVEAAKLPYTYVRLGSSFDISTGVAGGVVLMGGSYDVDAAFPWLCERAGQGDFLVVRATGTDAYNPYIKNLCPNLNSVATLIVPSVEAANHADVAAIIAKAEAIWIAGGDQSNYVNYWQGTGMQAAINSRVAAGMPIGGTSAGLTVLTQFIYSALGSKGATSEQALADPFNRYMTFDHDLVDLPILTGAIGDSHFSARDRMGRDLAFLCRVHGFGWSTRPRAIAVDEETALLVEPSGKAGVVGIGRAYFLQAPGAPEVCRSGTPLTYRNIAVYRVGAGASFDLARWSGRGGYGYSLSVESGVVYSSQPSGSIY